MSTLKLRGMLSLAGVEFAYSFFSLVVVTGYLIFTASVCRMGQPESMTVGNFVKFVLMLQVLFLPSLIRTAIDFGA